MDHPAATTTRHPTTLYHRNAEVNRAVMKMAAQYPVGFASSSREREALAVQLKAALESHSPWERYAPEIKHCARKEFNAERMRRTLYACFQKCAEQGPRR